MIYAISFADQQLSIECHGPGAEKVVNFLFPTAAQDMPGENDPFLKLKAVDQEDGWHILLYKEQQKISQSHKTGVVAAIVLDEVVSWFAGECRMGPTLHTAVVMTDDQRTILFPGKSGSGKSTLSAWLARDGHGYLTDELACLVNDTRSTVVGFARPIHLKEPMANYFREMVVNDQEQGPPNCTENIWKSNQGLLVPAGQLNPAAFVQMPATPPVAAIVFPTFQKGAQCEMKPISSAQSFARMMGIVVNARNFKDHAVEPIAKLIRDVPSYALTYGPLEQVIPTLAPLFHKR